MNKGPSFVVVGQRYFYRDKFQILSEYFDYGAMNAPRKAQLHSLQHLHP